MTKPHPMCSRKCWLDDQDKFFSFLNDFWSRIAKSQVGSLVLFSATTRHFATKARPIL